MTQRAEQIRAGLKHPVIDGDGHWMEPIPVFLEYLREVGRRRSPSTRSGRSGARRRRVVPVHAGRSASTIACAARSGGA